MSSSIERLTAKGMDSVALERQRVLILDNAEPLVEISAQIFPRVSPHPYLKLGAPYGNSTPYFLRETAAIKLQYAAQVLEDKHPGYKLLIYDGYRPLAVQQFMVDFTLAELAREAGFDPHLLSEEQRSNLLQKVFLLWARPNPDPLAPPPHSTGGAIDLSILDAQGDELDMGAPFDAMPPEGLPNYFANSSDQNSIRFHQNRQLLAEVMSAAGFVQLPWEWWHFSYGDQWWAFLKSHMGEVQSCAIYGRVDLS